MSEVQHSETPLSNMAFVMELDDLHTVAGEDADEPDDREINKGLRQLPSRSAHRSLHRTSTRRRRQSSARRGSVKSTHDVEVVNIEDFVSDETEEDLVDPKELNQPMSQKRRYKRSVKNFKEQKEISRWKSFRLRVAMYWQLTSSSISEWSRDLELWKGHLKEVEGRFGNGVLSFFIFLKWLLFLNLVIFFLEFGLVSLPTIIIIGNNTAPPSSNSCNFEQLKPISISSRSLSDLMIDFITGQGWINSTLMFYAGYPRSKLLSKDEVEYDLPLAYLLVGAGYFFVSLLLMVRNLARSFQESYIESGGTSTSFCNKVFASWDYCISNENTAKVKSQNIVQSIRKFQQAAAKVNPFLQTLLSFAPSLTITILNLVLPIVFNALSSFEDWSPGFEVSINMFRTVLLKLASIAVLMITLYVQVEKKCNEDEDSCCQQASLQAHCLFQEIAIRIGTFFSPLMPAMGVIKLFILFYVEKVSLMCNNEPSQRVYQGTRSNYLFTVLLLISFLMCLVAVGWGITRVRPSCIGPFRRAIFNEGIIHLLCLCFLFVCHFFLATSNVNCEETKRILGVLSTEIDTWPTWLQEIIRYVGTAAFIFPVMMIVCLMLYYFRSMMKSHLHMIEMLKDQLVLEGRDKRFLMEKLVHDTKIPRGYEDDDGSFSAGGLTQQASRQPADNFF
ncbi:Transmembrane channel-like protein 7 [Acropora cervicornis]|uniref:Transmembrane channel-like protein 7 n=1 Tax=Acropora cervicornis TaxID=6130 RepID=A0AAD9R2R8_ACRCE|nr:Transmembrane channel-like protein 7 [Acropora cervicornis]